MQTLFLRIPLLTRQLFLFSLLLCVFQSCLGPKKINKWVAKQYGEIPAPNKPKADFIKITSNMPTMENRLSKNKRSFAFIVLLAMGL